MANVDMKLSDADREISIILASDSPCGNAISEIFKLYERVSEISRQVLVMALAGRLVATEAYSRNLLKQISER